MQRLASDHVRNKHVESEQQAHSGLERSVGKGVGKEGSDLSALAGVADAARHRIHEHHRQIRSAHRTLEVEWLLHLAHNLEEHRLTLG
jgi:hypothetical protein